MVSVNARDADIPRLLDAVSEHEPIVIIGDGGKSAVLISEADWRGIQETLYLNSIPGLADSIIEAAKDPLEECVDYEPDEEW